MSTVRDSVDNAYFSGFFDGEGSIIIHTMAEQGRNPLLQISISNTNMAVLEAFKSNFGGRVRPEKPHGGGKKPIWAWYLTKAEDINKFLVSIYPFSIVKRRQVEISIEISKLIVKQKKASSNKFRLSAKDEATRNDLFECLRAEKMRLKTITVT